MKNNVILALSLAVALVGCGSKSGSSGGSYSTGAGSTAAPSTQQNSNNGMLLTVPLQNTNNNTNNNTSNNTQPQPSPSPAAPSAPTISGITPSSGGAGVVVTITGANFAGLSDVQIGGVSLTNVTYAPTEIQGTTQQGPAGPADVVVFSSNGNATLPGAFTYNTSAPPPPSTTYTNTISGILNNNACTTCHSASRHQNGVTLSSYSGVMQQATSGNGPGSTIVQTLTNGAMSSYGMSAADIQTISDWITAGAAQ